MKKAFRNSVFSDQRNAKPISSKNYGKPVKWFCQDCNLIFTSEIQALEHFMGKKHQNVIKNKSPYDKYSDLKFKAGEPCAASNKGFCGKFKNICDCKSASFDYWRSRYGTNDLEEIVPQPAGRDNILETVIKSEKKKVSPSDLSIFRTPSGKYYCQVCNLTVNSQAQFMQHSESRRHKCKTSRSFSKIK